MRESMVSLERRVPHASEAMVPWERGVCGGRARCGARDAGA